MRLLIDVGNTNIVFAFCKGKEITERFRCKTDPLRTADEYSAFLLPLMSRAGIALEQIDTVIVGSVVPDVNMPLAQACKKSINTKPIFVDHEDIGLKIKLNKPEEAGADRLVNALAVRIHYKASPAIIIDFGTATTFDVLDDEGAYVGGAIAPGVNLSMQALYKAAAKLPKIKLDRPAQAIGKNTVDAMRSGLYFGYVSMIEGMIARLEEELDTKPFIIATGGLANMFAASIPAIETVDQDLTLRGLMAIYERQEKISV